MLIITAGDNKNHRWKRKPKKKQRQEKTKEWHKLQWKCES